MADSLNWDESGWPIVEVRFPDGSFGKSTMLEYATRVATVLDRKERFAVIVLHETAGGGMDKDARVAAAEMNKAREDDFRTYQRALAVVSSSMVARTALTAIGWISPFPYPSKAFRTRKEAVVWVTQRLAK